MKRMLLVKPLGEYVFHFHTTPYDIPTLTITNTGTTASADDVSTAADNKSDYPPPGHPPSFQHRCWLQWPKGEGGSVTVAGPGSDRSRALKRKQDLPSDQLPLSGRGYIHRSQTPSANLHVVVNEGILNILKNHFRIVLLHFVVW